MNSKAKKVVKQESDVAPTLQEFNDGNMSFLQDLQIIVSKSILKLLNKVKRTYLKLFS